MEALSTKCPKVGKVKYGEVIGHVIRCNQRREMEKATLQK